MSYILLVGSLLPLLTPNHSTKCSFFVPCKRQTRIEFTTFQRRTTTKHTSSPFTISRTVLSISFTSYLGLLVLVSFGIIISSLLYFFRPIHILNLPTPPGVVCAQPQHNISRKAAELSFHSTVGFVLKGSTQQQQPTDRELIRTDTIYTTPPELLFYLMSSTSWHTVVGAGNKNNGAGLVPKTDITTCTIWRTKLLTTPPHIQFVLPLSLSGRVSSLSPTSDIFVPVNPATQQLAHFNGGSRTRNRSTDRNANVKPTDGYSMSWGTKTQRTTERSMYLWWEMLESEWQK